MGDLKKNILIYRLGSLGDTIMALPCFHQILKAFPDANIVLLTNKPVDTKAAPLVAVLGKGLFFNEVIDYPVGNRNPFLILNLLIKLRSYHFDCMVNLTAVRSETAAKRDKLFFGLAGIKRMIGFPSDTNDFIQQIDAKTGEIEWEAKSIARRIAPIGIPDLSIASNWDLKLTIEEKKEATHQLSKLPKDMKCISLSPGTMAMTTPVGRCSTSTRASVTRSSSCWPPWEAPWPMRRSQHESLWRSGLFQQSPQPRRSTHS